MTVNVNKVRFVDLGCRVQLLVCDMESLYIGRKFVTHDDFITALAFTLNKHKKQKVRKE